MLLRYADQGEEVPAIRLQPKSWNKRAVVWIDRLGKQSLFGPDGRPRPAICKLLSAGTAVVGVDLFGQGEFTADGNPLVKARLVEITNKGHLEPAGYAGFTFGYNHPLFSQRVHDILSVVSWLRSGPAATEKIDLVGLAGAGHWVAAARAQAGGAIDRAAVDTGGFRFARLSAIDDPDFLPGGAKYGDLPGVLALSAPLPLWVAGEAACPPLPAAAYQAAHRTDNLSTFQGDPEETEAAAVAWLLHE